MQLNVTIDDVSTTINQKYICKADPCFYLAVRSTDVPREMRISTIDSLHDCEELLFQNFKKATRSSALLHTIAILIFFVHAFRHGDCQMTWFYYPSNRNTGKLDTE